VERHSARTTKLWRIKPEQYDSVTTTISDYLRNTGEEELTEGIQRDLTRLFENPQEGANALRRRLLR